MRTIILAVLLGLFISSVATAAPSNPCKFRVLSSGHITFAKVCTATERRLLPHAVKSVKAHYTLKADLKSAMRSAQGFYTRHCKKVVGRRKASSRNWAKCYDRLPSSMMQQQMMIPSISLQTYVWEMCNKVRSLDKLASCAVKAASDENGQINNTIWEAVEAFHTLKTQKTTARKYIKAVTGCKLAASGKLKCASSAGLVLAAILMFLLGRLRPQLRITIGVVAMVIGMAACINQANAACSNPKLMPALTKVSTGTNLRGESVKVKMPRIVSIIVAKCELQESQDLAMLEGQKKEFMRAYDLLAEPSGAMINYCTTLRGTENISSCFEQQRGAEKALNLLVKKAQDLYWDRYDRVEEEKRAAEKAAESKAAQELLEEGNQQLEESIKVLKDLNNLVVEEGSCGGFLIVLLYGLLGMLGGCRSKLLVVLVALGSMTSLADAACTSAELSGNKVAAQYGMKLYDCAEKKETRQLDVKASIRAYFTSKRYTKRLDENPGRLDRITAAFEAVYGGEPIEVQKLALALCLKETGCGFSEASSWKVSGGKVVRSHAIYEREVYMSRAEACGIIQVGTRGLKGECARLNSSFAYAFKAQLNWLRTHWNQGIKDRNGRLPKVDLYSSGSWQRGIKRGKNGSTTYYVYRYNGGGGTAWEYGRVVMEEIYPLMG